MTLRKFELFHEIKPSFGYNRGVFPDRYLHVATVECETLGQVFELTNHIDTSWFENPEVMLTEDCLALRAGGWHGPRSTSVGDCVKDDKGQVWVCQSVGWAKLDEEAQVRA